MIETKFQFARIDASGRERMKRAILACFSSPPDLIAATLSEFSPADWKNAQYWLDISGLALYLYDWLRFLGLEKLIPAPALVTVQENLRENRTRTQALFEEAAAIGEAMQSEGIEFALLKGITLTPDSVPDAALRSQADLDLLVSADQATAARHVIGAFGYELHAVCGDTFEFRAGAMGKPDIRDMYRNHSLRALELHLLARSLNGHAANDRLVRTHLRNFAGRRLPVLSPPDILVQQAQHLLKHLCGEHTRASWVLEFWRHVEARRFDGRFWTEVQSIAATEPQAEIALGAAALLTTLFSGGDVPHALTRFAERLPHGVRRWIHNYAARVLLADRPGTKLYLILRRQLSTTKSENAQIRRLVFPAHLPPAVTRATEGERLWAKLLRYQVEIAYILARLRFHLIEGLRLAVESVRWRWLAAGVSR